MSGFKSFGERTVTIRLSSGFTCIVGPNGAGKSNIIDALCFCLGRLSKKTMRAKSLEDLIFAGAKGKNPSNRASVTIYFDNREKLFPGEGDSFSITRTIKRGGGGGYKMNGEKVTRQQILNALAAANIDPEGSNQFVLQGKIVELTHMNAEDRRKFIEELIGLQKYDDMKNATMKELEKAERDLGQFEAIFKEVSTQLQKVEKEKNDALAWKELEEKINLYNAQLIAIKITKLRKEEDELEASIEESQKVIEELEEKITHQEDLMKQESLVMDGIQSTITEKENEREQIKESITQIKTQLSSNKTTLSYSKNTIEKLTQDIENLKSKQIVLEEGQTLDGLIENASKENENIENNIETAKQEIEKSQESQAEFDSKIKSSESDKSNLKAEISKIKQKISSNNAQIKILRENIVKNESKREKLQQELDRLKGDAEGIDEAIKQARDVENSIRKNIDDLNKKVSEENQKQKDLERKINDTQEKKNQLARKISDFQATLSSANTEVKMNLDRIENLNKQKASIEAKIKDLSKGKDSEEALKALLKEKEAITSVLGGLKQRAKEEDSVFRKNEKELELKEMQQSALITEINDHKGKINNINTELKLLKKEYTGLEREKKDLEMKVDSISKTNTTIESEFETLNIKKDNITRRIEELNEEKNGVLKRIESSEEDYERNKDDISGVLQILNMLTQNISISVDSIKGDIQLSNAESIEVSAGKFRDFIKDIIEIMRTLQDVDVDAKEGDESGMLLNSIVTTLNIFTENADGTIEQLIEKVKLSSDVAIQESTSKFDTFVQDLMDILQTVPISLKKLTLSKGQELYKQLEEISDSIKSQSDDLTEVEKKRTELDIKLKHDTENLLAYKRRLEEIDKRIQDLNAKIAKSDDEINERAESVNNKQEDVQKFENDVMALKKTKEEYWEKISKIQEEIDAKQKEFDEFQNKLQELKGIQNLFERIDEINENIGALNTTIEEKKKAVLDIETSSKNVEAEQETLQKEINGLNSDKEQFWVVTEDLRKKKEGESKKLEEVIDRIRGLENVMRIITSIEDLTKENEEASANIQTSDKEIETLNAQVDGIQAKVDEVQGVIDSLSEEKSKEIDVQKGAQKKLNDLNKELQKSQSRLNELNKNKERQQQIVTLGEEIKATEKSLENVVQEIESLEGGLSEKNTVLDEKQEEINKYLAEKDESWKKQKQYQKAYTDLKSDLSLESSKLNNFESKKIICNDQIEALFHRSKDYGAIPQVTEDLTEEGLQSDIELSTKKKKALEPVNLKAIDQYDVVKERFDEIDMRRQTIQRERKAILDAIEKIELEKTRSFMKAYHEINREFSRIFQKLSPGGSAKMILDRPDSPFEGGISIEARPRGKKISSLEILSGGEKTLVALSFIFAVQEFYPAPFYVMDEIDAALDGPNVHRVSTVIQEFSSQAQFLVISHREENIVNSDRIYGVAMQQSGITDIFSVDLEQEAKRLLEIEEDQKEGEEESEDETSDDNEDNLSDE